MKRKRYKVRIKLIFETTMDHSQESMVKAKQDVDRVLTDYLKNKKLNILNLFQEPPRNNIGNKYSPTVLIAPITSKVNSKPNLPTHVIIKKNGKITHDSIILIEQIRVIDKQRLQEYLCRIEPEKIDEINKAMIEAFDITNKYK